MLMKPEFFQDFQKNNPVSIVTKICPMGAQLFHVDRHDKANCRFSQFCDCALILDGEEALEHFIHGMTTPIVTEEVTGDDTVVNPTRQK
jgi:hypothetical protein